MPPRIRRRITTAKREEIEKEQEAISRSIVRPFDKVSDLPVSYSKPPYEKYEEVLKNPLTVKDSGILYRSLMKSRQNYINMAPMFQLYWVKQSLYSRKMQADQAANINRKPVLGTEINARDVMVKLTDCGLTVGPHNFEVRLFIVKDERSETKKEDENKLEVGDSEVMAGSQLQGGIQDMAQSNEPTNISEVVTSKDIPKDASEAVSSDISQPPSNEAPKVAAQDVNVPNAPESVSNDVSEDMVKNGSQDETHSNDVTKLDSNEEIKVDTIADPNNVSEVTKDESNDQINQNKLQENVKQSSAMEVDDSSVISMENTPVPPNENIEPTIINNNDTLNNNTTEDNNKAENNNKIGDNNKADDGTVDPTAGFPKKKKYDPSDLESPINQTMIQNLRAIAKIDPMLSKLIDVVSSETQTPEQYHMFQGYVARAREMGPPPHPYLLPGFQIDPFQPLRVKRLLKEIRQIRDSTMFTSTFAKDQRLTAFQEKYLLDAILLFEFVDNPNVRYRIPRHSITEVLPSQNSGEERDILVSFLWIHNQNELDKYNKELEDYNKAIEEKAKEEEKKLKEEEEKKKQEEEKQKLIAEGKLPPDSTDDSNVEVKLEEPKSRTRRGRAPPPPKKKKVPKVEKELTPPVEPELRFTPVSFVLHDIPVKFVPIITNSVINADEARKYMSNIIDKGTRSSSFYLWYQVDGKLDEALAENVRSELVNEEKKMTGLVYSSTGNSGPTKKRKIMNIGQPLTSSQS